MEAGKSTFTGVRRWISRPSAWAVLGLLIFFTGAALGWLWLGSPSQRLNADRFVYGQPVQLMHDQMHYRMMGTTLITPASGTIPQADLPVSFHNFGVVKQSQIASWSFEIANRGDAPLSISSGYTTCSCTTAELSTASIPPNKSGLVTVYFDPQHALPGSVVRRGIILETNDPQRSQVEIWIQATVGN